MPSPVARTLLVLLAFCAILLSRAFGLRPLPGLGRAFLPMAEVLLAVLGALWLGHRGLDLRRGLGLGPVPRAGILLALVGSLPMALGLSLPEGAATPGDVYEALRTALGPGPEGLPKLLSALWVGAILAPIGEELLFRGFAVRGLLDGGWPRARAIVVPGLLFGLLHLPGAWSAGPASALGSAALTAVGGIWFGWLFLRWGRSAWVPIAAHMAMNAWWIAGSVGPTAASGGLGANLGRAAAIAIITWGTLRWTSDEA